MSSKDVGASEGTQARKRRDSQSSISSLREITAVKVSSGDAPPLTKDAQRQQALVDIWKKASQQSSSEESPQEVLPGSSSSRPYQSALSSRSGERAQSGLNPWKGDKIPELRTKDFIRERPDDSDRPDRVNKQIRRFNEQLAWITKDPDTQEALKHLSSDQKEYFMKYITEISEAFAKYSQEAIKDYGQTPVLPSQFGPKEAFRKVKNLNAIIKDIHKNLNIAGQLWEKINYVRGSSRFLQGNDRKNVDENFSKAFSIIEKEYGNTLNYNYSIDDYFLTANIESRKNAWIKLKKPIIWLEKVSVYIAKRMKTKPSDPVTNTESVTVEFSSSGSLDKSQRILESAKELRIETLPPYERGGAPPNYQASRDQTWLEWFRGEGRLSTETLLPYLEGRIDGVRGMKSNMPTFNRLSEENKMIQRWISDHNGVFREIPWLRDMYLLTKSEIEKAESKVIAAHRELSKLEMTYAQLMTSPGGVDNRVDHDFTLYIRNAGRNLECDIDDYKQAFIDTLGIVQDLHDFHFGKSIPYSLSQIQNRTPSMTEHQVHLPEIHSSENIKSNRLLIHEMVEKGRSMQNQQKKKMIEERKIEEDFRAEVSKTLKEDYLDEVRKSLKTSNRPYSDSERASLGNNANSLGITSTEIGSNTVPRSNTWP